MPSHKTGRFALDAPGFCHADSKAMLELIAEASNPINGIQLCECKRRVFDGISRLIAASAWFWSISKINAADQELFDVAAGLDGGWQDAEERDDCVAAHSSVEFRVATN